MSGNDLRADLKFNGNAAVYLKLENLSSNPSTTDNARIFYNTSDDDMKLYMGGLSTPGWRNVIADRVYSAGDDFRNITTITGSTTTHTAIETEYIYFINTTGLVTIDLPPSPQSYKVYRFIKSVSMANDLIIDATFNTIDGASTITMSTQRYCGIYFDSSDWFTFYLH